MTAERKRPLAADWDAAFDELVGAHHTDMMRLAYGLVGDSETAADVVQAAWTAAWRHRSELRDAGKVRAWLLTITANHARKALRWRSLRRWLPLANAPEPRAPQPAVEPTLDLMAALQTLPLRDRQILLLRYVLEESSAEIGRQVGLSDSAVRVRIGRLLAKLRENLGDD